VATAHPASRKAFAQKNEANDDRTSKSLVAPCDVHAATRMKYIVSTGYSSHWPPAVEQRSTKGSRPPVNCSVPYSGTMSE
jgi:hypothetical protein